MRLLSIFLLKCLFVSSAYSVNFDSLFIKGCETTKMYVGISLILWLFYFVESFLILEVYVLIVFSFFMLCIM